MNTEPNAAAPSPRLRVERIAVAVLAAAALLAGCTGQRDPGSYTSDVQRDFVSGCWTTTVFDQNPEIDVAQADNRVDREAKATEAAPASEVRAAKTMCSCAYDRIKENVKFGEFRSVNEDLREEGGQLPDAFANAFDSCRRGT